MLKKYRKENKKNNKLSKFLAMAAFVGSAVFVPAAHADDSVLDERFSAKNRMTFAPTEDLGILNLAHNEGFGTVGDAVDEYISYQIDADHLMRTASVSENVEIRYKDGVVTQTDKAQEVASSGEINVSSNVAGDKKILKQVQNDNKISRGQDNYTLAIGGVSTGGAAELPTPTLDVLHAQDPAAYPNGSIYQYPAESTVENYTIQLKLGEISVSENINWENTGTSVVDFVWDDTNDQGTGTIGAGLPASSSSEINYYTYTYTMPAGYTKTSNSASVTTSNLRNKLFYGITGSNSFVVYNTGDKSSVNIVSDFIANSRTNGDGGTIFNANKLGNISGSFIGNTSYGDGAAINNYGGGSLGIITGDFIDNIAGYNNSSSGDGGAIYNKDSSAGQGTSTITAINGNFLRNFAGEGGAIYNGSLGSIGSINANFISNLAAGDGGGAIYNSGLISSITGDFIANNNNRAGRGGAIYNFNGTINSIAGDFVGNYGTTTLTSWDYVEGGAIHNCYGTINSIVGNFIGNYSVGPANGKSYAGAIFNGPANRVYNANSKIVLGNTTFIDNYIYNNGTKTPNSIYNAGVINIADGATVTINDGYDGSDGAQLNIGSGENSGSIFNLSVDNNFIQTDTLGQVSNNGEINWDLDVDLLGLTSDNINATISGTNSIIIRTINLMTDREGETNITFTSDSPIGAYVLSSAINSNIISPGGLEYTVAYNNSTGVLTFNGEIPYVPPTLGDSTIDLIRAASEEYLASDHDVYELGSSSGSDKLSVVINGLTYYFTPSEDEKDVLTDLAHTGNGAIIETDDPAKAVYSLEVDDGQGGVRTAYYTYSIRKLPVSGYVLTESDNPTHLEVTDYVWNDTTKQLDEKTYDLTLRKDTYGSGSGSVSYGWTDDGSGNYSFGKVNAGASNEVARAKYTNTYGTGDGKFYWLWDNDNNFVKTDADNAQVTYNYKNNYTFADGTPNTSVYFRWGSDGKLYDGNSSNANIVYNYDSSKQLSRFDNTTTRTDVNGVFISPNSINNGGAINNTTGSIETINADFIKGSATNYGGGIYNSSTLGNVNANFIKNNAGYGGGLYNTSEITSVTGDFIGNNASSQGGGIFNVGYGNIGKVYGNFIGNTSYNGGGIYGYGGTHIGTLHGDFVGNIATNTGGGMFTDGYITEMTGNFIGNSAEQGGGIYNSREIITLTGDFVGNSASDFGGALVNSSINAKIESVIGNFVGNSAATIGGAIYNNEAPIYNIKGLFLNNSANYGAAIYNLNTIGNINGDFIGNSADYSGAAIYNAGASSKIETIVGDFIGNTLKTEQTGSGGAAINNIGTIITLNSLFIGNDSSDNSGGAIYNSGLISSLSGDFIGNKTTKSGGGIYNTGSAIGSLTGDFTNNSASINGGAIFTGSLVTAITGDFVGNNAGSHGGAIYNEKDVTTIISNFTNNSAFNGSGGAIYNTNGSIQLMSGNFKNNYAKLSGGGLYSVGNSVIDTVNADFISNTADILGGGLYNEGTITTLDGDFISNTAGQDGGAIYNHDGTITDLSGNINGNTATTGKGGGIYNYGATATIVNLSADFDGNTSADVGGAIYNNGTITNLNSDFSNNSAASGGAIYNVNTISNMAANFIDNHAAEHGGAIWTNRDLTLTADNKALTISGNWIGTESDKVYEAIYVAGDNRTFTFDAVNGGSITINDIVNGEGGYNIHFNGDAAGSVLMNNEVQNAKITPSAENVLNGSSLGLYNSKLYLNNGTNAEMALTSLTSRGDTNEVYIDFDVMNKASDVISATAASTGVLTIASFNLPGGQSFADITEEMSKAGYKVQILKLPTGSTLQLALSDEAQAQLGTTEFVTGESTTVTDREINAVTNWDYIYKQIVTHDTDFGTLGLAKTDTDNDSIAINYSRTGTVITDGDVMGDTFKLVLNSPTPGEREFTAGESYSDYQLTDNLGELGGTQLTVDGNNYASQHLGINGNSKSGIIVGEGKTLIFKNIGTAYVYDDGSYSYSNGANGFVSGNGGVIDNSGNLTVQDVVFYNNKTTGNKGHVIHNTAAIDEITGKYIANGDISNGSGIIANNGANAIITTINADFYANKSAQGGAIGNYNGAIISQLSGNFYDNRVSNSGGAIYTDGASLLNIENSVFKYNYADNTGGAIYKGSGEAEISISNTNFISNYANNTDDNTKGGAAISNAGTMRLSDTTFTGNASSGSKGGAIYNTGDLYINSNSVDVVFNNNKTGVTITGDSGERSVSGGSYNDIYNSGTVSLNANGTHLVRFNGVFENASDSSTVNINKDSSINGGSYIFNNDFKNGILNIYNGANIDFGTVTQDDYSVTYGHIDVDSLKAIGSSSTINLANNYIQGHNFGETHLESDLILNIDMNLDGDELLTDSINAVYGSGSGKIYINTITLIGSKLFSDIDDNFKIQILHSDSDNLQLDISDAVKFQIGNTSVHRVYQDTTTVTGADEVGEITAYTDGFYNWERTDTVDHFGIIGLTKTNTINDSIGYLEDYTEVTPGTRVNVSSLGDTLRLVVQSPTPVERSFIAGGASSDYVVGENLDSLGGTKLTIDGGSSFLGIVGNGYHGIEVGDGKSLVIQNVGYADNYGNISSSWHGSSSFGDSETVTGAGVVRNNGNLEISDSAFYANHGNISGGVISNNADAVVKGISNTVFSTNDVNGDGGAIYNSGTINNIKSSKFIANEIIDSGVGGAVYNTGSIGYLNASFTDNKSKGNGGAIYNSGTITIAANAGDSDVVFTNNMANDTYNAIYQNASTSDAVINLNAASDYSVTFNDSIAGQLSGENKSIININKDNLLYTDNNGSNMSVDFGGKYNFNDVVSGNDINIYNGAKIKLGSYLHPEDVNSYGVFNLTNHNFTTDESSATIDMTNSHIDNNNFGLVTLGSDLHTKLDLNISDDGSSGQIDNIKLIANSTGKNVIIDDLSIIGGSLDNLTKDFVVQVLDESGSGSIKLAISNELQQVFDAHEKIIDRIAAHDDDDAVTENTLWTKIFYTHSTTEKIISGKLGLVTTNTEHDSLGMIETTSTGGITSDEVRGDTLRLVVEATSPNNRSFVSASNQNADYQVTEDLGTLGGTKLIIQGDGVYGIRGSEEVDNGNGGTLVLNHKGITIADGQTLEIKDVGSWHYASSEEGYTDGDVVVDHSFGGFKDSHSESAISMSVMGGAVYNGGGTVNITDSVISDNIASYNAESNIFGYGAVVYNDGGIVNILADEQDVLFHGNSAYDGAIYNDVNSKLTIKSTTDKSVIFSDNLGGAISNRGNAYINNAYFQNNTTSAVAENLAGAIFNDGNMLVKNSVFRENQSQNSAGAIINTGNMTIESSEFSNNIANYAGAAILNKEANLNIYAGVDGDVVFRENKFGTEYNAIHNVTDSNNNSVVNLNAKSGYSVIFNDSVTGAYNTDENGRAIININRSDLSYTDENNSSHNIETNGRYVFNSSVSGNDVNLYNNAQVVLGSYNSDVASSLGNFNLAGHNFTNDENGGFIDMANSHIQGQNLGNVTLNSDLGVNLDIDIAADGSSADIDTITLFANTDSNGRIVLNDLSILNGSLDSLQKGFAVKILTNTGNGVLELAISDELDAILAAHEHEIERIGDIAVDDEVQIHNAWTDKFYHHTTTQRINYGRLGLATSEGGTTNDSLVIYESRHTGGEEAGSLIGDSLALVSQSSLAERSFETRDAEALYEVDRSKAVVGLGETGAGVLNITGASDGDKKSRIDLKGAEGFKLVNATELNLRDVRIGGSDEIISVGNEEASVHMRDSIIDGDIVGTDPYIMTTSGTNELLGAVSNARLTNSGLLYVGGAISGEVENEGTDSELEVRTGGSISGDITNGGLLRANAGSLSGAIENNNRLEYVGEGVNGNSISGSGTTYVLSGAKVENGGLINQRLEIANGGEVISSGSNLGGAIDNAGLLKLSGELNKMVSGSGETVLMSDMVFSDGANVDGTLDLSGKNITVSSGEITTHNVGNLKGNANLALDIDFTGSDVIIDTINAQSNGSGIITISNLNAIGDKRDFDIQVISGVDSNMKVELAQSVKDAFNYRNSTEEKLPAQINTDTKWSDKYQRDVITTYVGKEITAHETSISYETVTTTETHSEDAGDTLAVVNTSNHGDRNFTTDNVNDKYVVKENLGETGAGEFSIQGASKGNKRSTIDMNAHSGFILKKDNTDLTLKDVKITNASELVKAINKNTTINIDNSELTNNGLGIKTAGNINVKGHSKIDDKIVLMSSDSKMNVDASDDVDLNSTITGVSGSVLAIKDGTVNFGDKTMIAGVDTQFKDTILNVNNETSLSNLNSKFEGNNTLNILNNKIGTVAFNNLKLSGILNMNVDADLAQKRMDNITASSLSVNPGAKINVRKMNILSPTTDLKFRILFTPNKKLANIVNYTGKGEVAYSPIYKYQTAYSIEEGKGYFRFSRDGGTDPDDFNPAVFATPVAALVGGTLTQADTLQNSFYHADTYFKYPHQDRLAAENINKYAFGGNATPTWIKTPLPETAQGMWVKPYTTFEKVHLNSGLKVSNTVYGALYGGDSEIKQLRHGYKGVVSAFVGYNGAHQSYDGVSMNQQGGVLGVTGTLYKGNFFSALTLSAGASAGEANTMYGNDHFTMLTAGAASKTGYNWELKNGKFIIQPSMYIGYTYANTLNYTNAAGLDISSKGLNTIQLAPGVKIIGNFKNGWQPYAGIDMVWNIMGKTNYTANDTRLPELSIKPYVQYGVGLQKSWGGRFTAYGNAMLRNGGRSGIVFQAGFRWALGKDYHDYPNYTPSGRKGLPIFPDRIKKDLKKKYIIYTEPGQVIDKKTGEIIKDPKRGIDNTAKYKQKKQDNFVPRPEFLQPNATINMTPRQDAVPDVSKVAPKHEVLSPEATVKYIPKQVSQPATKQVQKQKPVKTTVVKPQTEKQVKKQQIVKTNSEKPQTISQNVQSQTQPQAQPKKVIKQLSTPQKQRLIRSSLTSNSGNIKKL